MDWQIAYVIAVIVLMLLALIFEVARPDIILFTTMIVFLLTNVINIQEALIGFSNAGMLTIALLFIIAGVIQRSGLFNQIVSRMLGERSSPRGAMFKMMLPISGMSAFLNNTPIVVTFTPIVRKWCRDHNISPSKFLIPLSYITIMGGMITLMGTSTNLVVHGYLVGHGHEGFSVFQLAVVGIPVAIVGMIYLVTLGYKILPNHRELSEKMEETSREYLAEMIVQKDYSHIGKSVKDAGLRSLQGLFLIEIIRADGTHISPVKSSTEMKKDDRLIFTGEVSTIAELQNTKGLMLEPSQDVSLDLLENGNTQLVEAVVSHESSLISEKIRDTQFRSKFDAAVIAVHRQNERVEGKIGEIALKAGDTLLLLAGPDFKSRQRQFNDFYVVTPMGNPFVTKKDTRKGLITVGLLVAMILLVIFGVLTMFKAMAFTVLILIFSRIVTLDEAKDSISFDILLLIASAFGIGQAIEESGTAHWVASNIVDLAAPFGVIALLVIVYLLTNLFTELITNNAAALMMLPIAMGIAEQANINPTALAVLVAIAASSSFVTPIGYQTNLIVMGPGGYKFTDYFKVGIPLTFIVMIIAVTVVNIVWVG